MFFWQSIRAYRRLNDDYHSRERQWTWGFGAKGSAWNALNDAFEMFVVSIFWPVFFLGKAAMLPGYCAAAVMFLRRRSKLLRANREIEKRRVLEASVEDMAKTIVPKERR